MMDRRGWQVMTHAIGDGAVRMTLDAYERRREGEPRAAAGRRHRVEHAETIDPADFPRFAQQNTIVSYMPFHANPTPAQLTVWTTNIGPERSSRGWIVRTMQQAGARLVFGSDWPVVSLDPRLEIKMAVTRRTADGQPKEGWLPEQAISLESAIENITIGRGLCVVRREPGRDASLPGCSPTSSSCRRTSSRSRRRAFSTRSST